MRNQSISISNEFKKPNPVILIVDDLYSNRMILREMLKRIKINTIEAKNGLEAVNEVANSFSNTSEISIELILMDLNMPVMNGVEATIEIRKLEKLHNKHKEIPIVAVTAQEDDRKTCLKVGMQEYSQKPISSKILGNLIKTFAQKLL